jgi:predicted permease
MRTAPLPVNLCPQPAVVLCRHRHVRDPSAAGSLRRLGLKQMDTLLQDLRFALRLLLKDRSFAATVILTLAICIGANVAIFTVVRSVLLRPLPYPEADRLVFAYDGFPGAGVDRAGSSVPNYLDRLKLVPAFESQALYQFTGYTVGEGAAAEGIAGMSVTPSFFKVLRTMPYRGRLFTEEEATEGHDRVAILSFGYWQRAFASSDGAIGRDIHLNGEPYKIIGVMPDGFAFLNPDVAVWVPTVFNAEQRSEDARWSQNHDQIARLAPDATLAQAQQQIDAQTKRNIENAGPVKQLLVNAGYHSTLVPLEADVVRHVRRTLHLLWGGVLFVLLIAAANITNLVLVRASSRMKELATRHALGAGHGRMARQLLTETLVLTVIGSLLGLAVGIWSLGWLSSLGLAELPRGHEIRTDWVVVAFTFGLALVQGVVISALPLAQLAGLNMNLVLRDDSRTGTAGRRTGLVRRALVTIELALAFVLLMGAGLLFASFRQLLAVDLGFKAEHVLTGRVGLPWAQYEKDARRIEFTRRALERIRRLPDVVAAGVTDTIPFGYGSSSSVIVAEGYVMAPGESVISPNHMRVTPGYFEALGVPLKRGRFFTESDTAGAPRVVIIDERLAKKFYPNVDPIGRRMFQPDKPDDLVKPGPNIKWLQVVGVVGAVKLRELVEGEQARVGAYYFPYAQLSTTDLGFVIKTTGDPMQVAGAVRQALASIDPQLLFGDVKALPERVEGSLQPRRTPMLLSLGFGAVALLLAAVGIYGVLAYQVSQRTREIGIRMTLGSDAASILRLILREGAVLILVGLGAGIVGAIALRQVIASQLYGVGALDPVVLGSVSAVLALAAFLACLAPARRAARVDPVVALAQQ